MFKVISAILGVSLSLPAFADFQCTVELRSEGALYGIFTSEGMVQHTACLEALSACAKQAPMVKRPTCSAVRIDFMPNPVNPPSLPDWLMPE